MPAGTCWVHGTIPEGIKKMKNLTVFNVGNNWFSGTMPDWLPDLQHMRVLNLGSQFGGNEGTDRLGIMGTIPARIGELHYLRELVLEANSLTGTLPEALCHNSKAVFKQLYDACRVVAFILAVQ
jgi:LRR receptor-like serine/threonine-protein kinase FLS2